jgi:hypothetical protein
MTAPQGAVGLFNASNGGDGGNGEQLGGAGPGGSVNVLLGVATSNNSFNPGQPGKPCNYTATAKATVKNDPAGHNPFLGISNIVQGLVRLLQNAGIEITMGIKMTGTTAPGPNGTQTFTASGSGTINNRTAAGTFTNGVVTTDAQGRATSVAGVFTFGTNGALPGGQPVSYDVTMTNLTQAAASVSVIRR